MQIGPQVGSKMIAPLWIVGVGMFISRAHPQIESAIDLRTRESLGYVICTRVHYAQGVAATCYGWARRL